MHIPLKSIGVLLFQLKSLIKTVFLIISERLYSVSFLIPSGHKLKSIGAATEKASDCLNYR